MLLLAEQAHCLAKGKYVPNLRCPTHRIALQPQRNPAPALNPAGCRTESGLATDLAVSTGMNRDTDSVHF